jgi:Baseplate J-like protein
MSLLPFGEALAGDPEEIRNPNDDLAMQDVSRVGPDIATDERVIAEEIFDELATRVPGWLAHDGNLEVWLIEAFARATAELRTLAADVPAAIFVTYGVEVLGVPIIPPAPATGRGTWTATDDQGYVVAAGTQFTLARTGDDLVGFRVLAGVEIPPGQRSVEGVEFAAIEDGAQGNGLSGEGEVIDPLSWVESITVSAPTALGTDGQSQVEYLDELTGLLRIVALRPILPGDYALLALRATGGGRAVAMDGYDPETDTWGHARTITLVLADPDGEPWPASVLSGVRAQLEALREVNFVVNVISAHYQTVDVSYEVTAFAEQNPEIVLEACQFQLEQALSPANYRLGVTSAAITGGEVIPPPTGPDQPRRRLIRRNDLIGLLDRSRGVDFVQDVLIDGQEGDVELGSPITLPRPGAIEGVVNTQ